MHCVATGHVEHDRASLSPTGSGSANLERTNNCNSKQFPHPMIRCLHINGHLLARVSASAPLAKWRPRQAARGSFRVVRRHFGCERRLVPAC